MRDEYVKALTAIAVVGQSYSIGERSVTNADLNEIRQTLMEITAAIAQGMGQRRTRVSSNFAPRSWWRYGGAGPCGWGGQF